MQIKVSFVKNDRDKYPIDKALKYEELVAILTNFITCDKDKAPAVIGGYFNGKTRETDNLQARTLLLLDVDYYKGSINDLEVLFNRDLGIYRMIAYSTASHAINAPRIRIALFFSNEVPTQDYKNVSLNFINSLSAEFKSTLQIPTCIKANQLMYLPVKPYDDYIPWYTYHDGRLIDPTLYLHSHEIEESSDDQFLVTVKNNPLEINQNMIINYLESYPIEERDYWEWLEVGLALHHQYKGDSEGLVIWDRWSKKDPRPDKYKGLYELASKWDGFKTDSANPVTFATIIYKTNNTLPVSTNPRPVYKEKWVDFKLVGTKGNKYKMPLFTKANFKILLQEYNINIRFDEIKKVIDIDIDGKKIPDINDGITEIKLLCELNGLKTMHVNEIVTSIGNQNIYNSFQVWVCSSVWDGIKRFDDLCETVEVAPEFKEVRNLYLKKWFLQLINVTCLNDTDEAKVARMVLVFQGKQYSGKTSWLRSLVPPSQCKFIKEGITLKISDSMSVLKCIKHVIVELGEISATMRKSDVNELKNFISETHDTLNMKYVTHPVTFKRRTVFFGSVNENEFLQDQTDNTRFLCLPIINCNYNHNINMQQVYMELLEMSKTENYFLTPEDLQLQKNINSNFKSISALEEKFLQIFEVENHHTQSRKNMVIYNATNLLEELGFNMNQMVHKKSLTNEIARILDSYKFKRSVYPRGWFLPPKRVKKDLGF